MLNEERIKEAEANVRSYLEEELIKKVKKTDPNVKKILAGNCKESLKVAEYLFKSNLSNLWTLVCSYYAMYYIAKTVLYCLSSYKIGERISHKVTADALIARIRNRLKKTLLEEYEEAKEEALELAGLRTDELISTFDWERRKRSRFQYSMTETVMKAKAKTSLERAKKFVFEMEKLLESQDSK